MLAINGLAIAMVKGALMHQIVLFPWVMRVREREREMIKATH